ncbi:LL-diaminopimelate aminotransferase [Aerococcaceae bacterium WS4759]|uniref:Aminotransferase n=2 Tax=Fundicoccus ignavus TaxID=2664442 RepID=A0A6I2GND1_9LACT|nr:LL-diaminopimelate aminotransferase [Fundicoccus ignavus]
MMKPNTNYQKIPANYLFSTINQKVEQYKTQHPNSDLISLGIGDVTQPIVPAVIDALHKAVDEQASSETFQGYGPEGGYDFLRQSVAQHDFQDRGLAIDASEIFISDGAKSDIANLQELFEVNNKIAIGDPVYPVYIDSNALAGRLGDWNDQIGQWSDLTYLSSNEANQFIPKLPKQAVDVIYLCYPNNPTGMTLSKTELQTWVDYALENNSLILFDAAYEAYIQEANIPHSIYECEGATKCAIEVRSFSKKAGFTGLRLGYTVVPQDLTFQGQYLNKLWARRQTTKFNGAPYIIQRAGWACYQEPGNTQINEHIAYYTENARIIRAGLEEVGATVYGGINAPYIWLKVPNNLTSWEFFDTLLEATQVVGTPGSGFGPSGEGYFRLTAFNSRERTIQAVERIQAFFTQA